MPKPAPPRTVAAYATGAHRTRPGLFGLAVCEIRVEEPERSYWKRANAAEWEWCGVADNNVTIKMDADTSRLTAKIAEVTAVIDDLKAQAASAGIDIKAEVTKSAMFPRSKPATGSGRKKP